MQRGCAEDESVPIFPEEEVEVESGVKLPEELLLLEESVPDRFPLEDELLVTQLGLSEQENGLDEQQLFTQQFPPQIANVQSGALFEPPVVEEVLDEVDEVELVVELSDPDDELLLDELELDEEELEDDELLISPLELPPELEDELVSPLELPPLDDEELLELDEEDDEISPEEELEDDELLTSPLELPPLDEELLLELEELEPEEEEELEEDEVVDVELIPELEEEPEGQEPSGKPLTSFK